MKCFEINDIIFKESDNMDDNVDLAVAIDSVNRKIAELNMGILKNNSEELQNELNKWIKIRQEIYDGNAKLIRMVINNEI